jgi:4-diphosphocytidyl-2-C-methyl-D-erythritol kinase
MIVFPNAKINIGLKVLNKRPDGFHNLESIFYPIPWYDILEINQSDKFNFKTSGLIIDGETSQNLVVKAYKLIKNNYNIPHCNIHLHKQIPMGAGLGGGSADATFTLTLLNNLFNLKISKTELISLSDSLGSDCPFFIENQPKFVTGKGEIMTDIDFNLKGYYIKLINPNIHISTKSAFNGLNVNVQNKCNLKELTPQELFSNITCVRNNFETTVFNLHPELKQIKNQLLKEGALYASMTGTGSTIYGIFKNCPQVSFNQKKVVEKIINLNY